MHIPIKDSKYVRDISSKAVLNTDKQSLDEYLIRKEIAKKEKNEYNETKNRVNKIEEDMAEIKMLLQKLLGQNTNGN